MLKFDADLYKAIQGVSRLDRDVKAGSLGADYLAIGK
jgi:hypothetical protein